MDVLNRLKSAVSTVLPVGNPISGEFEILTHRASGGPAMFWKIYDGIQKSTKQEASVFLFEKKSIERFSKHERDIITESLKKGVSQLTRLRHPKVLSVIHPLEDSRESLAFATEPVFASLANVIGQHDNLPNPAPSYLKDFVLFDVEIKYGLLQVLEGLAFLHSSVKMIHGNLCPESIFINKTGCWKIAGFEFCTINTNQQGPPYYPFREWEPRMTPSAQPKLNYLAPEYAMTASCDTASDMFSVGILIYAIHNNGKPVFESLSDWNTFKKNVDELKQFRLSKLEGLSDLVKDHVKMLLNVEPSLRPDADQISKIPFFEDVGVMTLTYLDLLVQKDNLQKSQFFKGLPKVVAKLPKRVNLQRVLPSLSKECSNANMVPFILPNMIEVAEQATNEEYCQKIFPEFIPLFKITEPIQVMLIFLQNMNLLLSKTTQDDIRNHVLPMITRALEAGMPQMQELCLNIIPSFANLVEYASLKNAIIPRIKKLCLAAPTLSIRVNCLVCLGKLLEYLDKWFVLDEVLPILPSIPSREPSVLMSILGIYKVTLTHKKLGITKEMLASKILPFLFPLSIENGLGLSQYQSFMSVIKDMICRVESEHVAKLEQLNAVQQEQRTLQKFAQESVQTGSTSSGEITGHVDSSTMDSFLSGCGFGGGIGAMMNKNDTAASKTLANESVSKKPVQLTMEEKEKMMKQQEMQHRLKAQASIQPKPVASSNATKSNSRDLSSSLLENDFMSNIARPGTPLSLASTGGAQWAAPAPSFQPNLVGANAFGSQVRPSQPLLSSGKTMDLSALDDLLPSKPKMSMNQLGSSSSGVAGNQSNNWNSGVLGQSGTSAGMRHSGSMGSMAPVVNSNAMGNSRTVGSFGGMSTQGTPMPFQGVQSTMPGVLGGAAFGTSNPFLRPPGTGMSLMQPNAVHQSDSKTGSMPLSNKDIADLLG